MRGRRGRNSRFSRWRRWGSRGGGVDDRRREGGESLSFLDGFLHAAVSLNEVVNEFSRPAVGELLLAHPDHVKESFQLLIHIELGEAGVRIEANVGDVLEVSRHSYLILAQPFLVSASLLGLLA